MTVVANLSTETKRASNGSNLVLPVVPGAALVVKEDGGWFTAYFPPLGPDCDYISLFELGQPFPGIGVYATEASAEPRKLSGMDWSEYKEGMAIRDHRWWRVTATTQRRNAQGQLVTVAIDDLPVQLDTRVPAARPTEAAPWVVAGYTITKAEPCFPSACGALTDERNGR